MFTWTCLYTLEAPLHTGSLGKEDAEVGSIMSPVHPLLAPESSDKPVFRRPGFQELQAGTESGQLPWDVDFANRRNDIIGLVIHVGRV